MKNYRSYMDRVHVSNEFHNRLLTLNQPQKPRRPAWQKYGALAACAALLVGVGIYGVTHWKPAIGLGETFHPDAELAQVSGAIELAPEEPGFGESGMQTIPGFEVTTGTGPNAMVSYYILPWIDYGTKDAVGTAQTSMDYAAPEGSTFRALTQADVLALVGGEEALNTLLAWDGFEFSGSATFNPDGTVWQLTFAGKRDDFYFELELAPDALPLTCVIVEPHTTTEIWGVEVTGRYSGIHGEGANREVWMPESREVEFLANGVGCRFTLYGLEGESDAVETMVSRFVRHAILEGLNLSAVTADGAVLPDPDPAPGFSVGEPNWNDAATDPSVGPQGADTPAYDPE